MDLDQFKDQLKTKLSTTPVSLSDADIVLLLKKRIHSVLSKIKRRLQIEIIVGIISTVAFVVIALAAKSVFIKIYFTVFSILMLLVILYFIYHLKKTNDTTHSNLPIVQNLQCYVLHIKQFNKRNFQLTMALVPISIVFAGALKYIERAQTPELANSFIALKPWGILVAISIYLVVLFIGIYYFTKWYLQKLYGKYIQELNQCITELQYGE